MKKIIGSFAISCFLFVSLFLFFEADLVGAVDQTASTTPTSTLSFDVQVSVGAELSLTCPLGTKNMGSISGLSGGTANITADCGVRTNAEGYDLYIKASTTPAMIHTTNPSYVFSDYRSSTPEYIWGNNTASSSFGYAVSSTDVKSAFLNNSSACGLGSNISYEKCFVALSTTNRQIASREVSTGVTTITTTINFKAEVAVGNGQSFGTYSAGIVVTAVTR
ncbi:MAG: hypothetical protein WCV83_03250 [Candidatus Magasanikbacteria bacterium]|jgi:hypothetical protein